MYLKRTALITACLLTFGSRLFAQELQEYKDSVVLATTRVHCTANLRTGTVTYRYAGGSYLQNTVAYVEDTYAGMLASTDFGSHTYQLDQVRDDLGTGLKLTLQHSDDQHPLSLEQHITLYPELDYLLLDVVAQQHGTRPVETRNISPLAVSSAHGGTYQVAGNTPRILDVPFDNDNWTDIVERNWARPGSGTSYEFAALYDKQSFTGIVAGSVQHDTWKTGIAYNMQSPRAGSSPGMGQGSGLPGSGDSLIIYGGAATADNDKLPPNYGGKDGTHDVVPHGTLQGPRVHSPLIFLAGGMDMRAALTAYGKLNSLINGSQSWSGPAPVYWNSFGVEGVLGYEKVMMPPGVSKVSDFLHSLTNVNAYSKPVMSVDSYDQQIYTTELLASLGRYAAHNHQQMGFYFTPFAMWTWKNNINTQKVPGSDYLLKDVVLRDTHNEPIMYKAGDFCAYAMDPTHPAIRAHVISQLQKAKAIGATFLKIDFLTAGAMETTYRYDTTVRTGIQAYNQGMRMLKHLADSILGRDIFITQAISPMFPHQYAHTRFISTDVYSHLRNDQPGFPNWGSTEASLANGSHLGWVQGTLWPFTNLDVAIMKNFQHNPDLSEQEIKVRLYSMMVMGSILGDGSDYRNPVAAQRARKYLDNPALCAFFAHPRAFTPLQFADGDSMDQQMVFYLQDSVPKLALFNFDRQHAFPQTFTRDSLHLEAGKGYVLQDFLTNTTIATLDKTQNNFTLTANAADAVLVNIVRTKD